MTKKLFRGDHYGVFAGPNGYYVAEIAADGVSHQQPSSGGSGWSNEWLQQCNTEAEVWESDFEPIAN